MHHKQCVLLKAYIIGCLLIVPCELFATPPNDDKAAVEPTNNQTVIEENAPVQNDAQVTYFKDKSADQTPGDAAMLFHIPGLTLVENGGPLSTTEIRYRGLAHGRFRIDMEGLSLNNPLTGLTDANSMFLFAASKLQTNAQSLSISLPAIHHPQAKGVIGYGSQNSGKIGAMAGAPLDPYSSLFMATQFSTTDGSFTFSSPDLTKNDPTNSFTRVNNDQHRLQSLFKYERKTPTLDAHALLAFNVHEGGIAGFAFSPTTHLRSRAFYSGIAAGLKKKIGSAEFSIDTANSLFDFGTKDIPDNSEHLTASTHEITLGYRSLKLPKWIDFTFAQQVVLERAYQLDKTRIGAGLLMKRVMQWSGRLKPSVFANFGMLGFHSYGFLFKKDLGVSIEPRENIGITARMIRHQRLPTFVEMYSDNRFFVGNEDLKPESVWDFEVGSNFRFGQTARLQVTGFLGYLSDTIVYTPFLGTKLRPTNTDVARRYGVDLGLTVEPLSWLMFETKNSVLYTKILATNSPLPQAPPFLGLTKVRFGTDEFLSASLQSRYRGPTTGNLYGTLRSKPYALFDVLLSARLLNHLGLSLSISNIFNIKSARDSYEIPLPGTVFFGQIEVGNV